VDLVGDLARDIDVDADELRLKTESSRSLALRVEETNNSVLRREGITEVDAMDIAAIAYGDVGNYSLWTVMKLLAAAGMDVAVDVFIAAGKDGAIYVVEEGEGQ
jgi:hypothetical protein